MQMYFYAYLPIAIKQISLQCRSRFLLRVPRRLCLVLIIPIAVIPRTPVGLPWSQAHPAEVRLAVLVLADHVVAAAVLLDGDVAARALFRVGRDPVARLRVVVALLDPLFNQLTLDRVVPVLATTEAERVAALARHPVRLNVLHLDGIVAVRRRTPSKQSIALERRGGGLKCRWLFM